ncbi:hypothetical protein SAMN04487965_0951 [Microbulbifer donghaiensis]|uniref:DUF2306 domain-containing protein n=1 Tax=Microbulbifer donghaiensis TaxID=494016 RepID=A0A1M4XFX9_9GAMM|nr:hypothetical protein [Microbulbifer donghaiensis]SHE92092.1 hypothetical protein SAMN04487965_0951 [Microbulbifer donghaiensis]
MIWEPFDPVSYFIHVVLGFIAFGAGIVALSTQKGTSIHIRAGKVFAYLMILVALSTFAFMAYKFLPLALVLSIAVIYLIPSAINAFRNGRKFAKLWDRLLIVIPFLLCVFASMQFVRFQSIDTAPRVGPILLAATFGFLFFQDLLLLRNRERERYYWIRRHMTRMILAFTFTAMAVVRLGINVGLTLEQTVIFPTLIAWLCIAYCYKKYSPEKLTPARA